LFSFLNFAIVDFTYFCLFTPSLPILEPLFLFGSWPVCAGYVFILNIFNMLFAFLWKSRTCLDRQKAYRVWENVRGLHYRRESFTMGHSKIGVT